MVKTLGEYYLEARRALIGVRASSPDLEARELVCKAFGLDRSAFYGMRPYAAPEAGSGAYRALLDDRLGGKPLAYILGEWDFYGMTFAVDERVLIPRADTERLVDAALAYAVRKNKPSARVLDLCCGSGCVGVAIGAKLAGAGVTFCDLSRGALTVAEGNAALIKGTGRRHYFIEADALQAPPKLIGVFDFIVCNPPYIAREELARLDRSVVDFEPRLALDGGEDGLVFYRSIAARWKCVLRDGGAILFEVGHTQSRDVLGILFDEGYEAGEVFSDAAGVKRVVAASKL